MSRFPPIDPADLTPEQKEAQDYMSQVASKTFGDAFVYKNDKGAFLGPFAPLLYTPSLCKPFFDFVIALGSIPDLPAAARETAILTVGGIYKSAYEIYAHSRVAEKTAGLSKAQIESVLRGEKSQDLGERESVAFEVAKELCEKPGRLSDGLWKRAEDAFGKVGAAALLQYTGLYVWTCVLLNGAAVPLPEGEKEEL